MPLLLAFIGFGAYSTHTLSALVGSVGVVNTTWRNAAGATANEIEVLAMRGDAGKFLATGAEDHLKAAIAREQWGPGPQTASEARRRVARRVPRAVGES